MDRNETPSEAAARQVREWLARLLSQLAEQAVRDAQALSAAARGYR